MRTLLIALLTTVSLSALADSSSFVSPSSSIRMAAVDPARLDRLTPARSGDPVCHYGQLGAEDIAIMRSVQVRKEDPVCHYGQLSAEDLSIMASVRP